MSPRRVVRILASFFWSFRSCWRRRQNVALIVECPCPLQELPMRRAGGHVKGTRINQNLAALLLENHGVGCKTNVIADAHSNFAKRSVKVRHGVASCQSVGFEECNASWHVNIEKVGFSVFGYQFSLWIEDQTRIVYVVGFHLFFRDTSSNNPDIVLYRGLTKQRSRWRRSKLGGKIFVTDTGQFFGILWKGGSCIWTGPNLR
mmetsp:Transcript_27413/g.64257  ORF Transcript_27413/g.64257 Transcript_27413/m.64257 type:complete len:203 (+) Transcript_27413:543-1151(+)